MGPSSRRYGKNKSKNNNNNNNSNNVGNSIRSTGNKRRRSYQPPRGGPGILLTCETGKERICRQQGLEILQYYWDQQQSAQNSRATDDDDDINIAANDDETMAVKKEDRGIVNELTKDATAAPLVPKKLSLDEELLALKNQNKPHQRFQQRQKLPFEEFQTSCGGVVFLLYAPAVNEQKPTKTNTSTIEIKMNDHSNEPKDASNNGSEKAINHENVISTEVTITGKTSDKAVENNGDTENEGTSITNSSSIAVKNGTTTLDALPATTRPDWDPLAVVARVARDLQTTGRSSSHLPPSSRFITRMIPLQATCYASLDEIRTTVHQLVLNILKNEPTGVATSSAQETQLNTAPNQTPVTTYAVQFKRRFCEHLKRDQVIQTVAAQVAASTSTEPSLTSATTIATIVDKPPQRCAWKVNLRQPDYTIVVEVCQTFCGVSILSQEFLQQAKNMQLAELRTLASLATADNSEIHK